jgi:hypothetical protein
MAIDQFDMLAWLAQRERDSPGALPTGAMLRTEAGYLDPAGQGAPAVSQALARLRGQGWIDWVFSAWPNRTTEPPAHQIDDTTIQQVYDVHVSAPGYAALASKQPPVMTQQVNIVGSTVGQLALGDIRNINLLTILDAAERELERIDAADETRREVRTVLQRMRAAGAAVATGAGAELLGAAIRRALGLS